MHTFIRVGAALTGLDREGLIDDAILHVSDDRLVNVVRQDSIPRASAGEWVDATECVAIPGLVQNHIHLCQTLFRGLADDMTLLNWLQRRIFPYEAAHDERSMYASAMIGCAELLSSGTTTILDMGSIAHEEEVIRAVGEAGIRAHVGKALMDINDLYPRLKESTTEALRSMRVQAERWHGSYNGRVHYAPAPRFVLSCTERLLKEAAEFVTANPGMIFHTHASENTDEIEAVRRRTGMENIEYLNSVGALSAQSCCAHCIHVHEKEIELLRSTGTGVAHCPSSNLKLASGIANVPLLQSRGITVGLGADGAPCNNNLNALQEMRLASLIQKPYHGADALPARTVFRMATVDGAKTLGLGDMIGTLETGKKADIVLLNLNELWNPLAETEKREDALYSSIVFSASRENVDSVMIDGRWVYRKKHFLTLDAPALRREAREQLRALLARA